MDSVFSAPSSMEEVLGMNQENKINEKLSIDVLANQTVAQMVSSHLFKS